jgi:hypothetical protein
MSELNDKSFIIRLFKQVLKYGYNVRKYKLDGQKYWKMIDNEIKSTSSNYFMGGWTNRSYQFYTKLLEMGVVENKTSIITYDDWLYNHFLLQHGRLSQKECYLDRFLQIAYNAGQLAYCFKHDEGSYLYKPEYIQYYVMNGMSIPETYVNLDMIKIDSVKPNLLKLNTWLSEQIILIKKNIK